MKRWIAAASLLLAVPVLATKPCPPSPCAEKGSLDLAKCQEVATWIAVGTIADVKHNEAGPPLSKDFAQFTFTIREWEKGKVDGVKSLRFEVGWCNNMEPPPREATGLFRLYGAGTPGKEGEAPQYLHIERVEEKPAAKK